MKKSDLNRYLKELSKEELEVEVKKLYSKFGNVKKYYELELGQDTTKVLDEFKERIEHEYFPYGGLGRGGNRESRQVVTEFKKISIFQRDVVELLLYRVATMINYTNVYGDINEPFYNSLESSFGDACKLIKAEKLENEFQAECKRLINSCRDMGWGLCDGLEDRYDKYFVE